MIRFVCIKILAVIETLGPKLASLEVTHTDQISELNQITKQVSDFMERYNHTVGRLAVKVDRRAYSHVGYRLTRCPRFLFNGIIFLQTWNRMWAHWNVRKRLLDAEHTLIFFHEIKYQSLKIEMLFSV